MLDTLSSKAKEHRSSSHKQLMDCARKVSHNIVALHPHKCSPLLRMVSVSLLYMHKTKLRTKEIA